MPIPLYRNFWINFFFLVLYFQVSLFGTSDIENLKYNNTVYSFYQELFNYAKTNKLLTIFISESYLNKFFFKIHSKVYNNWNLINYDISLQWLLSYGFFIVAILYSISFLPYGRFYNKLGGNFSLLFSYFYIFGFLTFMFFRNSWVLNNVKINIIN